MWCTDMCTIVLNLLGDSLITHLRAYANGVSLYMRECVCVCVSNDRESLGVGSVQCTVSARAEH